MLLTFVTITALLLGVMGRFATPDVGGVLGSLGDISDDRSGPEKVAEIKQMMDKKRPRGGRKDKRAKMPPSFGGRDKGRERYPRRKPRHVAAMPDAHPGDLKIPPQEKERRRSERRRSVQEDEPPKRQPRMKPSVREAMQSKNVARAAKRKRERRRAVQPLLNSFKLKDGTGKEIRLDNEYFPQAKLFLIVNIASNSKPELLEQLVELESLYETFGPQGLEIIAFPSNSFDKEPLNDEEIQSLMREKYGVTFPVMAKCDVNGENSHPLYTFLKSQAVGGPPKVPEWAPLEESGLAETDIQWNFDKFLVHQSKRGGERVLRLPYDASPKMMEAIIERRIKLLSPKKEL